MIRGFFIKVDKTKQMCSYRTIIMTHKEYDFGSTRGMGKKQQRNGQHLNVVKAHSDVLTWN